jgi:tripartite-type tricarboxylate transporter receptor subunit TctC
MKMLRSIAFLGATLAAGTAFAQSYPSKPITLIVPYSAGQGADAAARVVADKLSGRLGQPIVVENRPGAGGNIGTYAASRTKPDGYTLLVGSNATHGANAALYSNLQFDPLNDFVPIAYIGAVPMVIVWRPSFEAPDIQGLVKAAKEKPGQISIALSSTTSRAVSHLLQKESGIKFNEVPYKGSAPALTDVLGGHVDLSIDTLIASAPQIRDGKLKAVAVTSVKRASALPDVPTMAESGFPGFELVPWNVWFAPTGIAPEILSKLNAEISEVLGDPEVQKRLRDLGYETGEKADTSKVAEFVKSEAKKWGDLIRDAGIKAE